MQSSRFLFLLILCCFGTPSFAQEFGPENVMIRENSSLVIVDTLQTTGATSYIILSNYKNEEVLIVVTDLLGNEIYSKVVFKNQCAVLKAYDPYNKIPSGVYTVTATNRNEIYNQRIVID